MKYRHAHHAGNFADVHKHVTLLALLAALQRKDKGLLYLETHAGRGAYAIGASAEAASGYGKLARAKPGSVELTDYLSHVAHYQKSHGGPHLYPGSPLLAAAVLREQDRGVFAEVVPSEATGLEIALGKEPSAARLRVERGDGFERLRSQLPPPERRGLTLVDPPYEETARDFLQVTAALGEALRRFATGCLTIWYPIKDERSISVWQAQLSRSLDPALAGEALVSELWLYPRDSRVALNGSGLLIVNPPYLIGDRMRQWLPELHELLGPLPGSGCSVHALSRPA